MIRHEFREEEGSLGKVLRPVADVVLEKDAFRVEIPMYRNSGVRNQWSSSARQDVSGNPVR